jgi:hypothetical protein
MAKIDAYTYKRRNNHIHVDIHVQVICKVESAHTQRHAR